MSNWTPEEIAVLRSEYQKIGTHACAALLQSRTWVAVAQKARLLGLRPRKVRTIRWGRFTYPFAALAIGESTFLAGAYYPNVRSSATLFHSRSDRRVRMSKRSGGVKVWRVA